MGHLTSAYQRVAQRERLARLGWAHSLPGIHVRDTESLQGLPARPKPHTCGIGRIVEIAQKDDMRILAGDALLDVINANAASGRSKIGPATMGNTTNHGQPRAPASPIKGAQSPGDR